MKKERKHTQRPGQNTNTGKEKTSFMTSNSGVKKTEHITKTLLFISRIIVQLLLTYFT